MQISEKTAALVAMVKVVLAEMDVEARQLIYLARTLGASRQLC